MLHYNEKGNFNKKHITKLNLKLQLGINTNNFIVSFNQQNNNFIKTDLNSSNLKKWNFFSPKLPEKKYEFDFNLIKNARYKSNTSKKNGLEFFLKLKNNIEKNPELNQYENDKFQFFSEERKDEIFNNHNNLTLKKNSKNINSKNNISENKENLIINREDIYHISKQKPSSANSSANILFKKNHQKGNFQSILMKTKKTTESISNQSN